MFLRKELESYINEELYKRYTVRFPYIKNHLPFKNVDVNKCSAVLELVTGSEIEYVVIDLKTVLEGGTSFVSAKATSLYNKVYLEEQKVKNALRNSSTVTQNLSFFLGQFDSTACLVGGSLRDVLVGKEPKDFDFVSSKSYDDLKEVFESTGYKVDETGKEFMVLRVSKDSEQFEIATFRKDVYKKKPKYVRRKNVQSEF